MKMLVLAGGFGTRLQPVLPGLPKVLAPMGDVPFLHLQLEHWIAAGQRSFVFLLHHHADLVIAFLRTHAKRLLAGCDVRWLVEVVPMGTGGAVAHAVQQMGLAGSFLLINADTWLGAAPSQVGCIPAPAIGVVQVQDAGRYGRVLMNDLGQVVGFNEKSSSPGAGWINAGLCHLESSSFRGWDGQPFSLERRTLPALAATGTLKAVELHTDFVDIGIPADYEQFRSRLVQHTQST